MTRGSIRGVSLAFLLATFLVFGAASAQANRALLAKKAFPTNPEPPFFPPPDGQIEGACGVAVSGGTLYVSDYYHHQIDVSSGSVIPVGTPPEGPCGLVFDSEGAFYVNIWHQSVVRLKPTLQTFDTNHSTGVAVDEADNVYVDDRTYIAVYDSSGKPILDKESNPLKVGLGSIGDGFDVAAHAGKVYVPDAEDNTVKVYEPASDPFKPSDTISRPGGFNSLVDASVAIDPTNGHLLVVDNLKPGFEHPQAGVYEFDSTGSFLGQLPGAPVHGGPSGIAVEPGGGVYVTDGNDEESNVFAYGPFSASLLFAPPPPESEPESASSSTSSQAPTLAGAALHLAGQSSPARPNPASRRPHRKRGLRSRERIGVADAFVVGGG